MGFTKPPFTFAQERDKSIKQSGCLWSHCQKYTVNNEIASKFWTQNFMIDIKGQCLHFRSIPRSNSIINRNQKSIHWTTGRKLGRDSQFALDHRYVWKPKAKEKDINCNLKSYIQKARCYVFWSTLKNYEQSRIDGRTVMYLNGNLMAVEKN